MSLFGKKGKSHVSFKGYQESGRGHHPRLGVNRLSVAGLSSRSSSRLGSAVSRSAAAEDTSLLVLKESEQEYM